MKQRYVWILAYNMAPEGQPIEVAFLRIFVDAASEEDAYRLGASEGSKKLPGPGCAWSQRLRV